MARALGARFLGKNGQELPEGGLALRDLERIDVSNLDPRLENTPVLVACDVTNPLCGSLGASFVYGPQKGADDALCRALDSSLSHYGKKLAELLGRDIADLPGAGAAGGLGAGLMAFCGGVLQPGFDEISRLVALEAKIQAADLVVTGEGRIDRTSAMGKVLSGVGAACQKFGRPAVAFGGGIGPGADDVLDCGIAAYCAIADGPMTLERAIADAAALLEAASARQARFLKAGTILNDV
jgi:glycerate 2-kinase